MKWKKTQSPIDSTVVSGSNNLFKPSRKIVLIGLVVLVILIIAGVVSWRIFKRDTSVQSVHVAAGLVCSGTVLRQAAMVVNQPKQLQSITESIKRLPNYDEDPNCLYVVLNYYIDISDPANARVYLDKFNKVYASSRGLNPILQSSTTSRTVSGLKANVAFLEKASKESLAHTREPGAP